MPAERLRHDRALRERLVRRLPRLVERLGASVRETFAERGQQQLQVRARVRLKRRQDLVELHRRRGLRDRERVALVDDRRAGAARLQVDEEVALQEDPRPHLERGVLVDRKRVVIERERDH